MVWEPCWKHRMIAQKTWVFSLWTTVCKTVHPMLSDCCLSVLSVCVSVTLVYCGQTVEWIKMKVGTQVDLGLGPGHIALHRI